MRVILLIPELDRAESDALQIKETERGSGERELQGRASCAVVVQFLAVARVYLRRCV